MLHATAPGRSHHGIDEEVRFGWNPDKVVLFDRASGASASATTAEFNRKINPLSRVPSWDLIRRAGSAGASSSTFRSMWLRMYRSDAARSGWKSQG